MDTELNIYDIKEALQERLSILKAIIKGPITNKDIVELLYLRNEITTGIELIIYNHIKKE